MAINPSSLSFLDEKNPVNVWKDVSSAIKQSREENELYQIYKYDERIEKNESIEGLTEEDIKKIRTIKVLDKLGFPLDEMGTYLYSSVVIKTIDCIKEGQTKELLTNLNTRCSDFYQQIAREDYLHLGTKTFHSYICNAIEKIDYDRADKAVTEEIFDKNLECASYGTQAFVIASYIVKKSKNNGDNPKVYVKA